MKYFDGLAVAFFFIYVNLHSNYKHYHIWIRSSALVKSASMRFIKSFKKMVTLGEILFDTCTTAICPSWGKSGALRQRTVLTFGVWHAVNRSLFAADEARGQLTIDRRRFRRFSAFRRTKTKHNRFSYTEPMNYSHRVKFSIDVLTDCSSLLLPSLRLILHR